MRHRIWNLLSHADIILSGMFLVFFCIDRVNPAMDFLGSALSKWLLLLFILCALGNGVCSAVHLFRKKRRAPFRNRPRRPSRRRCWNRVAGCTISGSSRARSTS